VAVWKRMFSRNRRTDRSVSARPAPGTTTRAARRRLAGLELMEPRCLLSVSPIQVGVVYLEQDNGSDVQGDLFEVTFDGGAEGTQLDRLIIDGDQQMNGFSIGDVFFDIRGGGLGADDPSAFRLGAQGGVDAVRAIVADGSTQLLLEFEGFEAGDRLFFEIDVDEVEDYDPTDDLGFANEGFDPITSGVEFQGSFLTADFSAENFFAVSGQAEFRNRYDASLLESNLDLPADDESNQRDRTAAAFVIGLQQQVIPATLSGYVYHDRNDDGSRDAGEEGIANVEIELIPVETVVPQESIIVTTDANGRYETGKLSPGTYRVVEIAQPSGFLDGRDSAGRVDGQSVGIALNDEIQQVALRGGDVGTEFNFGELVPVSLSGRVHLSDVDGDCFGQSATHEPVAGATVQLLDASGNVIDETITDSNGEYEFTGLHPGVYGLREITPAALLDGGSQAGFIEGQVAGRVDVGGAIREIELSSGENGTEFDFCEHVGASVSGNVFHDRNNDGVRDRGEEGIGQVLVSLLDQNGDTVAVDLTDESGRYAFERLAAGEYTIVETHPVGYSDGLDSPGTVNGILTGQANNPGDRIGNIRLPYGAVGENYNFGEYRQTAIRGRVQESTRDGDCFGESAQNSPIAGAVVQLLDAAGNVLATTQTNSNGEYAFEGLLPGEYGVREITPDSLLDGGARVGNIDGQSIGTIDEEGSVRGITLQSGESAVNVDFCDHVPATIGGIVYHDANNNGIREPAEDAIEGVTVELLDDTGIVVATAITDGSGSYQFVGLSAGTYSLREIHPTTYLDGIDTPGMLNGQPNGQADNPGDRIRDIDIGFGDRGTDYNFGELLPGSISGRVHADNNRDCVLDPGEVLLAGVTVQLIDSEGNLLDSTTTNESGEYTFVDVAPGTYTIRQIQGSDYFDGDQSAGSQGGDDSITNEIGQVTVGSGQQLTDYNFCDLPAAELTGYVFVDGAPIDVPFGGAPPERIADVRDGVRTPDDTMLPGVALQLRDGITGEVVVSESHALPGLYANGPITALTNAFGFYEFRGLRPGQYAVYEQQPAGDFIDGVDTPGTTSGIVFNPGEDVNTNVLTQLTVNPQNDAIVRIALAPGIESMENNFSEVSVNEIPRNRIPFQPPTTPIPPPRNPELVISYPASPNVPGLSGYNVQSIGSIAGGDKPRAWHLSVLNGGQPRGDGIETKSEGSIWFTAAASGRLDYVLNQGEWSLPTAYGAPSETPTKIFFGMAGAIPVAGDFNGDGFDEVGIYVAGEWFIDLNGDGKWNAGDLWAKLGTRKDMPVTGDWDGDGKWDIGIFGREWTDDPKAIAAEPGLPDSQNRTSDEFKNIPPRKADATNRARLLRRQSGEKIRADVIDHVFRFGRKDDFAVAGDWNGDGVSSIGVFRRGKWHLDVDGNGRWSEPDRVARFGKEGDIPVVGDFDGDGVDDLAVFRSGVFIIDTNGNGEIDANDQRIAMGRAGDYPVVGDFNGDGKDEVAIYRANGSSAAAYEARRAG